MKKTTYVIVFVVVMLMTIHVSAAGRGLLDQPVKPNTCLLCCIFGDCTKNQQVGANVASPPTTLSASHTTPDR